MKSIALEGIDGSGKSTQIERLSTRLIEEGHPHKIWHYTNKDNVWGRVIRSLYANTSRAPKKLTQSRYLQEFLYAFCARANFKRLNPSQNDLVLSDRSIICAYASHIDRLPFWFIDLVEPRQAPDLAVYLDLPPEQGFTRIQGRGVGFADENLVELRKFQADYQRVMTYERPKRLVSTRFINVDATGSQEQVFELIYNAIMPEIKGGKHGK